LLNVIPGHVT